MNIRRIVLGENRWTSLRYFGVAVALSTSVFVIMAVGFATGFSVLFIGLEAVAGLLLITAIPATIHAYNNEGLLVSLALAVGPILAEQEFVLIFRIGEPYPAEGLLYGVGSALLFGVPIGTAAFVIGHLLRRFGPKPLDSVQSESETEPSTR